MNTYAKIQELERRIEALEADRAPAAELRVDFASSAAAELANEAEIPATAFTDAEPTGATGFTVEDVKVAKRKRTKA